MRPINRETLPHLMSCGLQLARERIDSALAAMSASWWRVDMGKGCSVCGKVYFRRCPGSSIRIGHGCRFLSTFWSNRHGVNRPCMISAVQEESRITIGNNCGLSGAVIVSMESVEIGDRVFMGANTTVTDSDAHSLDYRQRLPTAFGLDATGFREDIRHSPVHIEDDVFIGMNSIILKGVTIGRGTVIGAGSVVSRSLPPMVVAAGQPAKPIARIELDMAYPGMAARLAGDAWRQRRS